MALRHRDEASALLGAIRVQRDRILRELRALPRVTVYPSDANFVLFVPPIEAGVAVAGAARSRRARPRPERRGAERAARHRGHRARDRPVPRPRSRRFSPDEPHRDDHARDEGDRPHRGARARRDGRRHGRHRDPVLRPHAAAARQARRVRPVGGVQGRPRGRRAPHRRGLRDRAGRGAARGARRQGGRAPVRVDRRAARRGGGRGVRSTSPGARSSSTRSPVPYETINGFDTGLLEDFVRAFAQSAELDDPCAPAVRALAAPHLRGDVQGAREGARRRVRARPAAAACPRRRGPCRADVRDGRPSSTTAAGTCTRSPARSRTSAPTCASSIGPTTSAGDAVLIPGVGHFGQCARALRAAGFEEPIRAAIDDGTPRDRRLRRDADPVRGERRGRRARARHPARARPAAASRRCACRTWAGTRSRGPAGATRSSPTSPTRRRSTSCTRSRPTSGADAVGATEHGRTFAAVVARGHVFATQFHPEKSGDAGLQLYANIVREVAA